MTERGSEAYPRHVFGRAFDLELAAQVERTVVDDLRGVLRCGLLGRAGLVRVAQGATWAALANLADVCLADLVRLAPWVAAVIYFGVTQIGKMV